MEAMVQDIIVNSPLVQRRVAGVGGLGRRPPESPIKFLIHQGTPFSFIFRDGSNCNGVRGFHFLVGKRLHKFSLIFNCLFKDANKKWLNIIETIP